MHAQLLIESLRLQRVEGPPRCLYSLGSQQKAESRISETPSAKTVQPTIAACVSDELVPDCQQQASQSSLAGSYDGDYEGWYRARLATADRVRGFAEQSAAKDRPDPASP